MERIKNYITQIRGVSYKPVDCSENFQKGYIPVLRANNIKNGKINFEKLIYVKQNKIKDEQYLKKGDILICTSSGSKDLVGKAALITDDIVCSFGAFCKVIRTSNNILPEYLNFYFQSNAYRNIISNSSNGANINNLKAESFDELQIEILSNEKQLKIIKKIEKILKVIDLKERQLNELDDLIKSQFVDMFENNNYKKICGKELFLFSSGKFLEASKRLEKGIPVYGGNGIAWYTNEPLIEYNTIVIGRVGAYCGNVKLIKEPVWITDNAIFIKQFKKDVYNIDFLYYMMELIDFSRFAQFSGQPKITQKPLEEFEYVIPPIELQNQFAEIVKQINKQKFEVQKSLEEIQKLQESLMNKYFG